MIILLICAVSCIAAVIAAGLIKNPSGKDTFFKRMKKLNKVGSIIKKFRHNKAADTGPEKDSGVIDYRQYNLTFSEKVKYTAAAAVVLLFMGFLFFKNMYFCLFLCCFSVFYPRIRRKGLLKRRKNILDLQFKDALYAVSSSLSAGKSVEGAFKASLEDLRILYPDDIGKDIYIVKEFEMINRRVEMNDTLENTLTDFALRAEVDDITNFVEVFLICKSTGGNLVEVLRNTSGIINQKIDIKNEIDVLVSEQKLSQKILSIMPFVLLILIATSSPDYIEPLYSPSGHIIMFIVLVMLLAAYFISEKIMDIKV